MKQLALGISPPPQPTLDNFVPGSNAELLLRLRELQAGKFAENVLYLWGEAGSGKSHLLRACAGLNPADDVEKLERWLQEHAWLVGDGYTLADLAVFAYVSMAQQGGFVMERFPAIAQWIARVKEQPGWVGLLHGEAAPQAT